MTTTDPLSLTEAKRLSANADTLLLRATRSADLETPIGAFLRLDDGETPAYLLESVEGGERLGRYSFLGVGPRRLLEVRDGLARTQLRPVFVAACQQQHGGRGAHEERHGGECESAPRHQFHPWRLWTVKRRVCEPVLPRMSLALTIRS